MVLIERIAEKARLGEKTPKELGLNSFKVGHSRKAKGSCTFRVGLIYWYYSSERYVVDQME